MDYLERMADFASNILHKLEETKRAVFEEKNAIDADFPNWRAKRTEYGSEYLMHESRREVFVSIVTLIENVQLSYITLRDQLTKNEWWQKHFDSVSTNKQQSVLNEYTLMIKWFLLHGLFSVIEETLRSIQRAAPERIPVSGHKSIAKVTKAILVASNQEIFSKLFQITRLTRNTIHTNGVFFPEDEQDVSLEYKGEEFQFTFGKIIEWLDDQKMIWFVNELTEAISAIVRSEAIQTIEYCPRTQI